MSLYAPWWAELQEPRLFSVTFTEFLTTLLRDESDSWRVKRSESPPLNNIQVLTDYLGTFLLQKNCVIRKELTAFIHFHFIYTFFHNSIWHAVLFRRRLRLGMVSV